MIQNFMQGNSYHISQKHIVLPNEHTLENYPRLIPIIATVYDTPENELCKLPIVFCTKSYFNKYIIQLIKLYKGDETMLNRVAQLGYLLYIQYLVENYKIKDDDLIDALDEATENGQYEVVEYLFKRSCIEKPWKATYAKHIASEKGYFRIVNFLRQYGVR